MMTRHQFLRSLAGAGAAVLGVSAIGACGSDGTGDPDPEPEADAAVNPMVDAAPNNPDASPAACTSASVAIGTNHGHAMTVAPADLDSTTDKTYPIQGTSQHPHSVTITVAQFQMLKANRTLQVSSMGGNHTHAVTVTCA